MVFVIAASLAALLAANGIERRATIIGGAGEQGRCTIEVDVDDAAEVEVVGDLGILRTISGQTSVWRRMECTSPLPRNMKSFDFQSIDGRGRQSLVQDPRTNSGHAVVRIEDRKGGRERYTFDLIWRNMVSIDPHDFSRGPRKPSPEVGLEVNFAGRGDGYFRTRTGNDRIGDLEFSVHGTDVQATFHTSYGSALAFTGKLVRSDSGRITAEMGGESATGTMYVDLERGRVRSVSMSGVTSGFGRARFDLRWHN